MRWLSLVLVVLVACTKEESTAKEDFATATSEDPVANGATAANCDKNASVGVELGGDWTYTGRGGSAKIQQSGSCVQVSATWARFGSDSGRDAELIASSWTRSAAAACSGSASLTRPATPVWAGGRIITSMTTACST